MSVRFESAPRPERMGAGGRLAPWLCGLHPGKTPSSIARLESTGSVGAARRHEPAMSFVGGLGAAGTQGSRAAKLEIALDGASNDRTVDRVSWCRRINR
jgi:hypothetical protein